MKEDDNIFKLKKELCDYLEENGFKKKHDDQIPERIYYVKHQDQSELSFEFPKDIYSPVGGINYLIRCFKISCTYS